MTAARPHGPSVLLLHGFAGSPFEMRELERRLESRGFRTYAPALPGHATRPSDLLDVSAQRYLEAAEAAWDEAARAGGRTYVVGLSMGGTLGLHLAGVRDVAGLVTISAPFAPPPLLAAGVPLVERVAPKLPVPSRIGPKLRGDEGYGSIPVASVSHFLALVERVRARIGDVTCPLLVVHSASDPTIPVANARLIHDGVKSPDRSMHIIKHGLHLLTRPDNIGYIEPAIGAFIERLEAGVT